MMNFLGPLIGYFILLVMVVAPGWSVYHFSSESLEALSFEQKSTGRVIRCSSIRQGSGNNVRYKKVPVVEFKDRKVYGTVDEIRFFSPCKGLIGSEIEVLHSDKKAKINTFLEMWFMPLLSVLICVIWYPALVMGYIRKSKKRRRKRQR